MGNCQAIDAATLVIQRPSGKADKLYWPVSAADIMKTNPGHYVALLISTTSFGPSSTSTSTSTSKAGSTTATSFRVTRIKLLRPTDTLMLGQVYRLITAPEVTKVLSAKKYAKMQKLGKPESVDKVLMGSDIKLDHLLVGRHESQRNHKTSSSSITTSNAGTPRPRSWQPSLQSISEGTS